MTGVDSPELLDKKVSSYKGGSGSSWNHRFTAYFANSAIVISEHLTKVNNKLPVVTASRGKDGIHTPQMDAECRTLNDKFKQLPVFDSPSQIEDWNRIAEENQKDSIVNLLDIFAESIIRLDSPQNSSGTFLHVPRFTSVFAYDWTMKKISDEGWFSMRVKSKNQHSLEEKVISELKTYRDFRKENKRLLRSYGSKAVLAHRYWLTLPRWRELSRELEKKRTSL